MEKLYVLVRSDLTPGQQVAQASHVVAKYAYEVASVGTWVNKNVVVLAADKDELLNWEIKLYRRMEPHTTFREPDMDHQITSIACVHDGNLFNDMELLT